MLTRVYLLQYYCERRTPFVVKAGAAQYACSFVVCGNRVCADGKSVKLRGGVYWGIRVYRNAWKVLRTSSQVCVCVEEEECWKGEDVRGSEPRCASGGERGRPRSPDKGRGRGHDEEVGLDEQRVRRMGYV